MKAKKKRNPGLGATMRDCGGKVVSFDKGVSHSGFTRSMDRAQKKPMKRSLYATICAVFFSGLAHAQVASMPKADPAPAGQAVSDGKARVTRDGRLVLCDSTGQAYEVTTNGSMVTHNPVWKAGKPVKCRRDMFVGL